MRVLVTGATGYLGGHVAALLAADGHEVRGLARSPAAAAALAAAGVESAAGDLDDESALRRLLRGVDAAVHCAASRSAWSRRDRAQRRVNVEGTVNLLRAAQATAARVVHVSSIAAVGATRGPRPLDEDASWNGRELGIHYVSTKREAEERALSAGLRGVPVVVVNPTMLVGPRRDGRPAGGFVARAARGAVRRAPPGGPSVADVEDVARGVVCALERGVPGRRYLLGGHDRTWLELAREVASCAGATAPAGTVPMLAVRALRAGATALDALRLSRPRWAPEVYRGWGWYGWADSRRATAELGYAIRPWAEVLERAVAATRPSTEWLS